MKKIKKGDVFIDRNDMLYVSNDRFLHFELGNDCWWLSLHEVGDETEMEFLFNVMDIKPTAKYKGDNK